ncbi:hypothetical protein [Flavihumibacter sp. CACIAM 22H1]|uniref:hypothetical protein n=1 Tax=Flavihumibacter sp. CACIAM 22H1 TaxID=1812911 RepID=UPI0007A85A50|nr:hypothetical protein [Flavihumibacter sp. CACIAM 22H1]KYP13623.1 MAG: hypothetical protein A1D16_08500 [Flavihumibacter sp. CACIAM 22H1]
MDNKYQYNGKNKQGREFSDGDGLEWYDYGTRMYDSQIGKWHWTENYSEVYYGLTPFNYGGNNPINPIDIDRNLFIFANGFLIDHWQSSKYNADRAMGKNGRIEYNPNYKPYLPDRAFILMDRRVQRESYGGARGGHSLDTWINDLINIG